MEPPTVNLIKSLKNLKKKIRPSKTDKAVVTPAVPRLDTLKWSDVNILALSQQPAILREQRIITSQSV